MQVKIRIKTPKGQAKGTEKKLRPFILGLKKPHKIETNKADNQIIWTIDDKPRKIMKITRNVAMYDTMLTQLLTNKSVKKSINKALDDKGKKELNTMLFKQTKVEVIHKGLSQ